MGSAILDKIEKTLDGPLDQEAHVVYLLAEIRKYLEFTNDQRFPKLRLFCNWALHSELGGPAAQRVVAQVDSYFHKSFTTGCTRTEFEMFERMLNLDEFRGELRGFLQDKNLPARVCNDDECWRYFISLYARVVEDCPMRLTGVTNSSTLVSEMVVSYVSSPTSSSGTSPHFFPMDWEFFHAGQKRGTLRLRPDGELPGATLDWK